MVVVLRRKISTRGFCCFRAKEMKTKLKRRERFLTQTTTREEDYLTVLFRIGEQRIYGVDIDG